MLLDGQPAEREGRVFILLQLGLHLPDLLVTLRRRERRRRRAKRKMERKERDERRRF